MLVCSAKRNAVVAMRWSQLFERDVPLELLKDMEIQKDACDRIIQASAQHALTQQATQTCNAAYNMNSGRTLTIAPFRQCCR